MIEDRDKFRVWDIKDKTTWRELFEGSRRVFGRKLIDRSTFQNK